MMTTLRNITSLRNWSRRVRPCETKNALTWWYGRGHLCARLGPPPGGVKSWWLDPEPSPSLARSSGGKKERQREKSGSPTGGKSCGHTKILIRKAKKIVKLLQAELSIKPAQPVPRSVTCGGLRGAVRSMYAHELTLVQELSIKTSAKAEGQPCAFCKNLQEEELVDAYEKARYAQVDVDAEHLDAFGRTFAGNIPQAWNRKAGQHPYVPNGGATLSSERRVGGNWNEEEFDTSCRVVPIFTNGKWRTVTLYSSHNVSVLSPLHDALYDSLSRKNWLLVGSPTDERLRYLQAGCSGTEWLSFDYIGATDNIKTAYVQRAVEILIDKGEGLTDDEVRCLRVVAELRLGDLGVATKGQPMGSPMSFPLLCLINKTIVDLALTDLLIKGEIPFKEWTGHRCLINGDDLLTRSTSKGSLSEAVFRHGSQVGMESNHEKTLTHPELGEINSTVFKNCARQKKTNVSALWMSAEVTDVLGYAHESCSSVKGFLAVVRMNVSRLARQKIKTFASLPWSRKEALLSDRRVKKALTSGPASKPPDDTNLFSVVAVPDGYDLSRAEEVEATLERVRDIRRRGLFVGLCSERKANAKIRRKIASKPNGKGCKAGLLKSLKPNKPDEKDRVPVCFVSYWEKKRKEALLAVDPPDVFTFTHPSDLSGIELCLDLIQTFKQKRRGQAQNPPPFGPAERCPFSEGDGFVSLADE